MICRNCGFQNTPGDAFCGSCGQFLEWTGEQAGEQAAEQAASSPTDETAVQPTYDPALQGQSAADDDQPPEAEPVPAAPLPPARHQARPARGEGPPRMARRAAPGVTYGAIVCWNCGRRNPPSRAFCQQCGERLSVASLAGRAGGEMAHPSSGGRARMLAIGLGVIALLLLAGGAAAFLFGGGPGPSATPTAGAVVTDAPSITPGLATLPPTELPTEPPTLPPTAPPTLPPTAPPTAPAATPLNCGSSTVPTNWVNLSGAERRARVRRDEAWCIHQVIVVPDPNFGSGTIRLLIGNQPLLVVTNSSSSSQAEYPSVYAPPQLVQPRRNVRWAMTCESGDFCNAIIQVGYELIEAP